MVTDIDHHEVRELRLSRPPVNALDPDLLVALRSAVTRAQSDGCQAIVLSGAPGVFSAGLDVPALLALDRVRLTETWQVFFGLLEALARAPIPVAAALTGHSPAGGTVLALFADRRFLAAGPYRVGLNEVEVGLPVPPVLFRALRYLVGERHAAQLAIEGRLVEPAHALALGLVDEVLPPDEVVPAAIAWAQALTRKPATALRETRRLARQPLCDAFDQVGPGFITGVVDQWFSEETQTVLRALVARLKKK